MTNTSPHPMNEPWTFTLVWWFLAQSSTTSLDIGCDDGAQEEEVYRRDVLAALTGQLLLLGYYLASS